MSNVKEQKKVLLMLSGGRDSFLSACRLISNGFFVYMVTYDNGCMSCSSNAMEVAKRIIHRFGSDKAQYVGIHMIAQNINPLMKQALYSSPIELCKDYPHLLMYQLRCLACHTAMYLHSIAFCKVYGIDYLSEGAREQQGFFVELPEMKQRYESLCKNYNLNLIMPVYDLESDVQRKLELAEWGFLPKSYEPQCWIGCPMEQSLSNDQLQSLTRYYDKAILPVLNDIIDRLIEKKKLKDICGENYFDYE